MFIKLHRILLFILLNIAMISCAPVQAPAQNPSLLETCLDEEIGKCISQAFQQGGWILLIAALVFVVGVAVLAAYGQGWLENLKKLGEKDSAKAIQRLDISENTRQYLEKVSKTYTRFKFRGLPRAVAKGIKPPELDQAYVSVRILPGSGHGGDEGKKGKSGGESAQIGHLEKTEPIELTEALKEIENHRLAVIGIAGSGKSTLLQWAGLACARANLGQKLTKEQNEFILALGGKSPIPFLIPLRAYNEYCKERKTHRVLKSLLDFMAHYFSQNQADCEFTADFFKRQFQAPCLLMFDGVDEVEPEHRPQVRVAIEQLLTEFDHRGLYCLITSRPSAAYIPDAMSGFRHCEVQRLAPEQRDELIRFWHRAVYSENQAEASKKAAELVNRLETANQQVRDLATTPLMVTIFCMVSYSHELPRLRARLYEDAVEVLLTETTFKEGDEFRGLEEWGGVDPETRRDRLAFIAFTLQARQVTFLLESDLVDLVWEHFGANKETAAEDARRFLRGVTEHGGLLEAQDDQYGFFTHATFQEYLAGRYLAEEFSPEEQEQFLEKHIADDQWEESLRLAAGYLSIKGQKQADRFVNLIAAMGHAEKERAHAITLAGLALSDIRADRRIPETVQTVAQDMLGVLTANPPRAGTRLRYRLGMALGEIDDPRFAPTPLSQLGRGAGGEGRVILPELVSIPAGTFQMGTSEEQEQSLKEQNVMVYDDEKPAHPVYLSEFSISKYPTTNAEYRLFWEQKGYENQDFWSDAGWRWRNGKEGEPDLSFISDEDVRKRYAAWLAERPVEKRGQPFFWDDLPWSALNLPVVGVTWFEAEAYAKWLKTISGQNYRLPTEAEWERAARGAQNTLWPWGNQWDEDRCNNAEPEDKITSTSPVGMYPQGTWPGGPMDMVGNVWEWCDEWYDEKAYVNRAGKEIKDPRGPAQGIVRVLRGGSFYDIRNDARCAYRFRSLPVFFYAVIGFRVVVAPIFESEL